MQFMMTNVKELLRLGIEEHELEKLNEATNDTDQDVQVVEILKHYFSYWNLKGGSVSCVSFGLIPLG